MRSLANIMLSLFLMWGLWAHGQTGTDTGRLDLGGQVLNASNEPLAGVSVSVESGVGTMTDAAGKFHISVSLGRELVFEHPGFQTARKRVEDAKPLKVVLAQQGEGGATVSGREPGRLTSAPSSKKKGLHAVYLDSARFHMRKDIAKSVDFVAASINEMEDGGDQNALAQSLSVLGEIYFFYKQYDLAADNFEQSLKINETFSTALWLARSHLLDKEVGLAEEVLLPLRNQRGVPRQQQVELLELLGDLKKAKRDLPGAVSLYQEGLQMAQQGRLSLQITDLNSKIADAYSEGNQFMEAERYYGNSLEMANQQTPTRALRENEKVADFYNKKNDYQEEIALRKNSLRELNKLNVRERGARELDLGDTLTSQRINYKIANAYIAQDKYSEAISHLEQSIVEADFEDDLLVQKDATRKLSEVYEVKGDFNKALQTYQAYVNVVDTLYVRKEEEISRAARFTREISSVQNRIKGLEQERELTASKYNLALTEQALSQESYKRQQWLIYSLVLGLCLMGLAAFFFYRSNQQQKLANNLLALKSLRSQMNPHFIFNALNSVNNFIAKNDERSANKYLSDFSKLMRSVLDNSEADFIPLSEELQLLELYVKLEHSRFPDKFDYHIEIEEGLNVEHFQIPPMLLQPYIENAIWHGLRYKRAKGTLEIRVAAVTGNQVQVTIRDNGIGRQASARAKTQHQKKKRSKGMANIARRVAILNKMQPDKVSIAINDLKEDGSGTEVILTLKKD
ncbi:histidine kinase [Maribacter sp. 2307ULW6-5]|uniref:histidine kinase n=1 Tax=Maribacter sp. 2307ULW6-5 TaxID=3386275 RepID=UPI0039BC4769